MKPRYRLRESWQPFHGSKLPKLAVTATLRPGGCSVSKHLERGEVWRASGKRGRAGFWSAGSSRRHRDYLQSIDYPAIEAEHGNGLAASLTVGAEIPTMREFRARLASFLAALRRRGYVVGDWCIEVQRRGAPHVHMAIFRRRRCAAEVTVLWLRQWEGALTFGQKVKEIRGASGWIKYLSKHGSRSARNYQRDARTFEAAGIVWEGRCWGHSQGIPTAGKLVFELQGNEGQTAEELYALIGARLKDAHDIPEGSAAYMRGCGFWWTPESAAAVFEGLAWRDRGSGEIVDAATLTRSVERNYNAAMPFAGWWPPSMEGESNG